MAVYLALDLILKSPVCLRQLASDGEDLAPVSDLAELGLKGNLLAENELVGCHIRSLARPGLLPVLRGFFNASGAARLVFPEPRLDQPRNADPTMPLAAMASDFEHRRLALQLAERD